MVEGLDGLIVLSTPFVGVAQLIPGGRHDRQFQTITEGDTHTVGAHGGTREFDDFRVFLDRSLILAKGV
jgi:hypothetical protein